jgi:hypothetical protein
MKMIGSVELFIILVLALIYLAVPLVTLYLVLRINQRLKNIEENLKPDQE